MKHKKQFLMITLFFLIILFLSPISGDDWGNYLVGKLGLKNIIDQAVDMYFTWEGRFISRVLMSFLTYHKWLWNILNTICIVFIIYFMTKTTKTENIKRVFILSVLSLLLMNIYTFSQVIVWIAGNITYLFSLVLILYYLYIIKKNWNTQNTKLQKTVLTLINIILPMFVEHMAILLIVINLFTVIIKYHQTKKVSKEYLIYTLISIISTTSMLLSPGTQSRNKTENIEFNQLNIFEKVLYNVPNYIYYTFIINSFLIGMLSLASIYRICKQKNKTIVKVLQIIYISIIPIITILVYNASQFINIPSTFLQFINQNNFYIQIYWITYMILYIYLLYKDNQKSTWDFIFTGLGLLSNLVMMASPTWGYRTSFATYIFLIIPAIHMLSSINVPKKIWQLINIGQYLLMIIYLIFYLNIYNAQKEREQLIKQQLNENKPIIQITSFPSFANCNINPTNEYHIEKFKQYYQIDNTKQIELLPNNWRYVIIK